MHGLEPHILPLNRIDGRGISERSDAVLSNGYAGNGETGK
jgi:hypothetical protein